MGALGTGIVKRLFIACHRSHVKSYNRQQVPLTRLKSSFLNTYNHQDSVVSLKYIDRLG